MREPTTRVLARLPGVTCCVDPKNSRYRDHGLIGAELILNHLDLYVPNVAATRDFFLQHFAFHHQVTRSANRLAVLYDDAGLELVISEPISRLGGAEQVALNVTTYHVGFRLESTKKVDDTFLGLQACMSQPIAPPKKLRGRYLFYCLAPGNILVEISASSDET